MTVRSVGVEEELLLVDPGTGRPLAVAEKALRIAGPDDIRQKDADGDIGESVEFELQQQQLETSTKPCFGAQRARRGTAPGAGR
jgi:carboxylate-amine ligase